MRQVVDGDLVDKLTTSKYLPINLFSVFQPSIPSQDNTFKPPEWLLDTIIEVVMEPDQPLDRLPFKFGILE